MSRGAAALLVAATLASCGGELDGDEAAVAEAIRAGLAEHAVPVLVEYAAGEREGDALRDALAEVARSARTDELLVLAEHPSNGRHGNDDGTRLAYVEDVMTVVGGDRGFCLAVLAVSDGTVRVEPVPGTPAQNCADAEVPASFRLDR